MKKIFYKICIVFVVLFPGAQIAYTAVPNPPETLLSGPFTVRPRDNRCMKIEETPFVEESMNRHRHMMTNAEDGAECIRSRA